MKLLNKLYLKFLNKLRYDLEKNPNTSNLIQLERDYSIQNDCILRNADISGKVSVGNNCKIIGGVKIRAYSKVSIGNYITYYAIDSS